MKVQNITDIDAFFKVVDNCKGRVELVTGEARQTESKVQTFSVCIYGEHFLKRRDSGTGDCCLRAGRHRKTDSVHDQWGIKDLRFEKYDRKMRKQKGSSLERIVLFGFWQIGRLEVNYEFCAFTCPYRI